jgi:hypothetical protein
VAVTFTVFEVLVMLLVAPRRQRMPVLALLVQAAGLPMRFLAGSLVWGGADWALAVYQVLTVILYFVAVALLAVRWQAQALQLAAQEQQLPPGELYFAARGGFWRYAGLLAALLAGGVLLVFQTLAERCLFAANSFLGGLYATCQANSLVYAKIGLLNGLLVAFDLLVILLLVGMLLARLVDRLQLARQGRLLAALNRLRMVLVAFFILLALAAVIMSVREVRAGWAIAGALAGILGMLFL